MKTVRSLFMLLACMIALVLAFSFGVSADGELNYGKSKLMEMERAEDYIGAYNTIYAAVENMEELIDLSRFRLNEEEFKMVFDLYLGDSGEHYRIQNEYGITVGDVVIKLKLKYSEGLDESLYRAAVERYVSYAKDANSEYEKALILHDALVNDITYIETENAHNSYGALVEGTAVCEGYTEAYQVLLEEVGIMSYKVSGLGGGGRHAWNLVRLDGKFYYTDVTWDDIILGGIDELEKPAFYAYFNVPEKYLYDHVADDEHGILPECTDTDKMYDGLALIESYTLQNVIGAFKTVNGHTIARLYYVGDGRNYFDTWISENMNELATALNIIADDYVRILPCGQELYIEVIHPLTVHTYDNACDTSCNVCGYTRRIRHDYSSIWSGDRNQHWHECTVCGFKKDVVDHNTEDNLCKICNKDVSIKAGDVDEKDGVDASDAIYLLYSVFFGQDRYPLNQACDFDENGQIEVEDAIYLLYHVFFGNTRYPLS